MIVSEIPYKDDYVEASCSLQKSDGIQLGALKCYNVNIQVEVEKDDKTKGLTTLTLREVPKFLVHAFNIIRSNLDMEGLFRKGGNNARINSFSRRLDNIFAGREQIPTELLVLDICSLIKSFLKKLKVPLLYQQSIVNGLLKLAERKESGQIITGEEVLELFRPRYGKSEGPMPDAHIGTLGFLMRELRRVSENSAKNGMTIENLATCFGPTLFDISPNWDKFKHKKSGGPVRVTYSMGSMDEAKQNSQRAATAVAILIERATWIGLHRECYVASQARSSSAAPLQRTPLSQLQPIPLDKRPSLPNHQDPTLTKFNEGSTVQDENLENRGFSSAVKQCARRSLDFFAHMSPIPGRRAFRSLLGGQKSSDTLTSDDDRLNAEPSSASEDLDHEHNHGRRSNSLALAMKANISNIFRGGRRKSMERISQLHSHLAPKKRDLSADSSASRSARLSAATGHQSRSRMRDSPQRPKEAVDFQIIQQDSQNWRKSYVRQPTPGPGGAATHKQPNLSMVLEATTPLAHNKKSPLGNDAKPNSISSKDPHAKRVPRLLDFGSPESPTKVPVSRVRPGSPLRSKPIREVVAHAYKDPSVSMLMPNINKDNILKKKERRRRHTTPVKANPLRRNHPNTVGNGLPRRRVTQAITAEEKENVMKRRSHSVEDVEETTGDSADDILDGQARTRFKPLDLDPRPRKTKRIRRRDTFSEAITTTVHASTSPTLPRFPTNLDTNVSAMTTSTENGVSPLTIATSMLHVSKPATFETLSKDSPNQEQISPGRILQVTPNQSPIATKAYHSPCPTQSSITVVSAVTRHTAIPAIVHERSGGNMNIKVEPSDDDRAYANEAGIFRRPKSPYSNPATERDKSTHELSSECLARSKARSTIIQQLSLDSGFRVPAMPTNLTRQTASRVSYGPGSTNYRSFATYSGSQEANVERPKSPFQTMSADSLRSDFSRKGISASVLDRHHFTSPDKGISRQRSAEEFADSDRHKTAIFTASSPSQLDMGHNLDLSDLRPSVAFISQNRRGLVRDRVNQFGGGNLSVSSGRQSSQSNASHQSDFGRFLQFDSPS